MSSIKISYIALYDVIDIIIAFCELVVLEVYQFARDAAVAEAWLIAQEPYLLSSDLGKGFDLTLQLIVLTHAKNILIYLFFILGYTIDEVENLIKKHEAFEKSAQAQEERFIALERLTTVLIISFCECLVKYGRHIVGTIISN